MGVGTGLTRRRAVRGWWESSGGGPGLWCAVLVQVPRIEIGPKEMTVTGLCVAQRRGQGAGNHPSFSLLGRPGCDLAWGALGQWQRVSSSSRWPTLRRSVQLPTLFCPGAHPTFSRLTDSRDRRSGPLLGSWVWWLGGGRSSPPAAPLSKAADVGEAEAIECEQV